MSSGAQRGREGAVGSEPNPPHIPRDAAWVWGTFQPLQKKNPSGSERAAKGQKGIPRGDSLAEFLPKRITLMRAGMASRY